ncbi:MAG: HAMP domain-containing histidine kinase [Oscillospiraceae bacterium]|nr:HAMP domain-containing histidine kinase [Oscillospiraceae bacterium]
MKWRENVAMKALAFIAAVAAFTATAIMGWYQLANFDALWGDAYLYDESNGYTQNYLVRQDSWHVRNLVELKDQAAEQELSLPQKRSLEQLEAALDAGATNLRWQLLDREGRVIYGNTQEDSFQADIDYEVEYRRGKGSIRNVDADAGWEYYGEDTVNGAVNTRDYDGVSYHSGWRTMLPTWAEAVREARAEGADAQLFDTQDDPITIMENQILTDNDGYTNVLRVVDSAGDFYVFFPTILACLEANRFGYLYEPVSEEWRLTPEAEAEAGQADSSLILWVDDALRVDDQYRKAAMKLEEWQGNRAQYLSATVVLGVLGILLTVYLCCSAGHKRGVEGVYLNWFHRAPGDVLLYILFCVGMGSAIIGMDQAMYAYGNAPMFMQLFVVGVAMAVCAAVGLGALVTVCARCKARTLLRNTWTWKLCAWCWRLFVCVWGWCWELFGAMGRAVAAIPLIWKAVMGCMAYTLFTIVTIDNGNATGLWLLVSFVVSLYLCAWAYQWKRIRHGTQEIIGGNPNYHINTNRMLPDLRGHADELNNLGHAISTAVDERMKSEHFKAELITNVSHDLKTPLTSIINYVDLLKKEKIDNPKAAEYIEVLDRKSQRLKKLTEDLVEASKASTGNLTVNWERLDWAQLTDQALAECGERLDAQKLTVVRSLPGEPLWVEADGRHLWRVLDNLLTNCAKYALPGTRVYVDLRSSGSWAVLSVKNISRDALDMPAERLMERFVRGDESRNQAGSGLGLSIAQSLTELQHGRFEISIDGDLFKAIVTLPLAGERPEDPIQLMLSQRPPQG